jgi:hypothetical protein
MSPPSRHPRWTLRLLAAAVPLVGVVVAWHFWPRPTPVPPRPLVLVVSGDTAGWIVPCGCTSNQSGGLLRRGSYVGGLGADADVIYADAGGAPGGTSAYHRVKFEAILRGELAMGLAAHNIGGPEAALGADYLNRVGRELAVTFVSANVRDANGTPLAEPLRIVVHTGRRVAITGILSRRFAVPGLQIDDPREAVLRAAGDARGRYDSLVVLAYAPEDELRQLAAALPEADAVIGGPTGQSLAPTQLGPTLLASATNKGKFVVRLDPAAGSLRGWTGQVVEMNASLPDDAGQQTNLHRYLNELGRRDFAAADTGLAPKLPAELPPDYRLAGNSACRSCHQADCTGWDASKHAHAWQTLADRGSHVDPYCQQCHTTGYGLPGGFVSLSRGESVRSVGCESCHGPSAGHVRDPKVRTMFAAKDQCATCHDRENSPLFAYDEYWPKIRHGGPANGGTKGTSR